MFSAWACPLKLYIVFRETRVPSRLLLDGWPLLPPSCSVDGQAEPLQLGAEIRPAPSPPHVKSAHSTVPHKVSPGPERSNGKKWPAGTSGTGRALLIGSRALLLRWIGMTVVAEVAASTVVQRSHAWCQIRGRPGLIWGEGGRAHLSPHACENGHPRLRQRHRWDRARIPAG